MASSSNLKKEINSINSIEKITQAMQLVATAKLKKIVKIIVNSKPYFSEIYTVFNDIISNSEASIYQKDPNKKVKKTAWVIINSNLGLCGGYNINLNKKVVNQIKQNDYVIVFGKKGKSFYEGNGIKINECIIDYDINFTYEDARSISSELLGKYNNLEFDEIKIAYTKFINNITFEPEVISLLPIEKKQTNNAKDLILTEFEPNAEKVLENSMSLYVNSILYSSVIESQVSEQASRRSAMENATNNANDMLDDLTLEYNRKRQSAITQEISEIVGGVNAQND
ncbi:ATP synthase F1 subunit gamma [Spiroplasma endosymbiont of Amphibalanus improvisus]|uniref:ATP synthase F1 subunit gamma n=1 Tax=Spiroplasma endosymbiont of Amphibalanus improvisus TaxID=3066327 RepID=UPI00313B25E6